MGKRVFGHMQVVKTFINIASAQSAYGFHCPLKANDDLRMHWRIWTYAILRKFEGGFSLYVAQTFAGP